LTDYFALATGIGQPDQEQRRQPDAPAPQGGLKGGIGPRYDDFANLRTPQQAAQPQPSAVASPERSAPQEASIVPVVDYFKAAAGVGGDSTAEPTNAPDPNATPDASTWLGRRMQDIEGKQDHRFKDVGTVFDQFPGELESPTAAAATFGADDAAMGDIIQKNLGDKFIRREKDANGYDIFVTRGPDGQEQMGYVNKPGLDLQDVARAGYGSLPYLAVGGVTGTALKGAGVGLRMLGQFAGNAGTSIAGDVAATAQGSEQGIDPTKAAIVGGFGAAAEPLASTGAALWRKFVTVPGLIDKTTGQLTTKGIEAARQAGLDPADITPDFAQSFAKSLATSGDPANAATQAGLERFGIPATEGQITKLPRLLTQEEGMARGNYGPAAEKTMQDFRRTQSDAIRYAAFGQDANSATPNLGTTAPKQGIGETLNPGRQPGGNPADRLPSALGNNVQSTLQQAREAARKQESALWPDEALTPKAVATEAPDSMTPLTGVKQTTLQMEAAPLLKDALKKNLEPFAHAISPENTPASYKMWNYLNDFMAGRKPNSALHNSLGLEGARDVDGVRKALGMMLDDATTNTDRAAARSIYQSYTDWLGDAAEQGLLNGDPATAIQLAKARGFSKDVRNIFQPKNADGTVSPAGQRIAKLLDTSKTDSGEAVINTLLGSAGQKGVSPGTISTLSNIKAALKRFASPDEANQAWNDIRLAHWSRIVTGRNGEMLGPTAILNNLKSAIQGQNSLMQTLYAPTELRQMREFAKALEAVSFTPPNASGSGYAAAQFAKESLFRLLDSFGVGKPVRTALEFSGLPSRWNKAAAEQAIRAVVRPPRPNLAPLAGAIGQADAQSRSQ